MSSSHTFGTERGRSSFCRKGISISSFLMRPMLLFRVTTHREVLLLPPGLGEEHPNGCLGLLWGLPSLRWSPAFIAGCTGQRMSSVGWSSGFYPALSFAFSPSGSVPSRHWDYGCFDLGDLPERMLSVARI